MGMLLLANKDTLDLTLSTQHKELNEYQNQCHVNIKLLHDQKS
jgi:hypothetical protein